MREVVMVIAFVARSVLLVTTSRAARRAGGTVSSPARLLFR